MNYDFNIFKKYKIKTTKLIKGKRIMKDSTTLLKNVYNKKEKLKRKGKMVLQNGGSKKKIEKINTEISEIENLHSNLKTLVLFNQGIIEVYSNH